MVWLYSLRQPSNNVATLPLTPTATIVLDSALFVPTFTSTPAISATDTPESIIPTNTSTSVPTDTPTFTPSALVNIGANLRSGPSTNYDIVGGLEKGSPVEAVATSGDGRWLELARGQWIYATLVDNIPAGLPIARNIPPTPTPTPTLTPTPVPPSPTFTPTLRLSTPTPIPTAERVREPSFQAKPTLQISTPTPIATSTPLPDLTEYERFMDRGDELRRQERYAEAVEAYSNAVEANAGKGKLYWLRHTRAYYARAIARFGQRCIYASILDYELALQTATYAGEPTMYNSIYISYSGAVDFYNQWGDGPCN